MFIQAENISIRAIEPDDASLIYKWENDKSSWSHSDNLLPYSYFEIEQFLLEGHDIYRNRQARFMVDVLNENENRTVGMIDLFEFHPHHKRAGIGIYIDSGFRRRGIGFRSLQLIIDYAFEVIGLHQIYCSMLSDNESSIKLFSRLGFVASGKQKDWFIYKGIYRDQLFMQLINPKH
ncbi:MAG TPA: GNAT family protein [Bacteroidales bacterium]|nr:GNAT family protein [Bacteroidales bacterium]